MATVINKRFEAEQEAARAFANTGIRSAGRSLSGLHGSGPFLTLTTAAAFASSTIAGKFASEALNPGSIILLRSLIALMFLAILAAPQGTAAFKVSRRHLLPIALLGASGIVGYVYFFLLSLNYTALSHTAIISSLSRDAHRRRGGHLDR